MEYQLDELAPQFGAAIRAHRHELGFTQHELASKAGLSVAAIRDFEQGRRLRPRASSLSALVHALGLDPEQTADLVRWAVTPSRSQGRSAVHDGDLTRAADTAVPRHGLWVTALGPLEAWRDGRPLTLGPPGRRVVLGLLLLNSGAPVRRDTIIDALWGEKPPDTAVSLVHAHVSRLRRALEPPGLARDDRVIESVRGAYLLRLPDRGLDLLVFRNLMEMAVVKRASGDNSTAYRLYQDAIALWRGDPLSDVELLRGYPGAMLLQQQLAGVLLGYADVAIALGHYDTVIPRLRTLASTEPFNEAVAARLMIALAGAGQQAVAISVYEDLRSRLDRELGVYPSEDLAEAHLRVLRRDIRTRNQVVSARATAYVVPRQLPAATRYFVGRTGQLAALSDLLLRDAGKANGITIAALTGMPGAGKTALAMHWAHQVADQFPDGQLFIDLRGAGPVGAPVAPADALSGFLTALGVPVARIPEETADRAALYRSLLADRRMLIVLDNADGAEQVRSLLPGSPGCLVLVTSRNRLTGLAAAEGAQLLGLPVLTEGESRDLLNRLLGVRAIAEPKAVGDLIALCGGLPLALCDVAAGTAARPSLSLGAFAAGMRSCVGPLDALETGESATSVRTVFLSSHRRLSEAAQRMFRLLGMHAGPDISVSAAASMAGVSRDQAYRLLAELDNEHLVTEQPPGRFESHHLLRAFAAERALVRDNAVERRATVHRGLSHYLHTANAAAAALSRAYFDVVRCQPPVGVLPEVFHDSERAAEWFGRERSVLLAAIKQAAADGRAPYTWQLPWVAGLCLDEAEDWPVLAAAQRSGLALARKLDDLLGQTVAHAHLGLLTFQLGAYAIAWRHLDEALELSRTLGVGWPATLVELTRLRVRSLWPSV